MEGQPKELLVQQNQDQEMNQSSSPSLADGGQVIKADPHAELAPKAYGLIDQSKDKQVAASQLL